MYLFLQHGKWVITATKMHDTAHSEATGRACRSIWFLRTRGWGQIVPVLAALAPRMATDPHPHHHHKHADSNENDSAVGNTTKHTRTGKVTPV